MIPKLAPNERIDWFRVLTDLKYEGYSCSALSRELDIPRSSLKDWRYGVSPKFEQAVRVLAYWADKCDREWAEIPITTNEISPAKAKLGLF